MSLRSRDRIRKAATPYACPHLVTPHRMGIELDLRIVEKAKKLSVAKRAPGTNTYRRVPVVTYIQTPKCEPRRDALARRHASQSAANHNE